MDTSEFQNLKQSPEQALETALREQPMLRERMQKAKRVTKVHSTGDYSYRNSKLAGNRWLLAGDAAGFIDPIFSTGVFLAVMSGEKAADALHQAMLTPGKCSILFSQYETSLQRVMKMYLRFVTHWYTQPFAEVFASPTAHFQLTAAINSVLAGNVGNSFAVWWRMELFYLVVFLQRFIRLVPPLTLKPSPNQAILKESGVE
jgi:2-polyprenyl-6-methoxyphenol hydroxylase-like FAD-dependent oxidoreductase